MVLNAIQTTDHHVKKGNCVKDLEDIHQHWRGGISAQEVT